MNQKKINALKFKAWDIVERYPIDSILSEVYNGPIKKRGNYIHFHCPNGCGSKNNDCCKVNTATNLAHCFNCGWGGNAATIYASFKGIDNMEAALILACRSGEISEDEVKECLDSTSNFNKLISDSKSKVTLLQKKSEEEAEYLAPVRMRNFVYTNLLKLDAFRLTEDGYRYLVNKRGLTDRQIKEYKFFTYSENFSIDEFVEQCKKSDSDFTYDMLWGIPGFYFVYTDENKTKGFWKFKAPCPNGLGIPLMDGEGNIQALQIRNMSEKAKLRYFFISSRNVKEENVAYTSSPGSPVGVCYPDVINNTTFLFTEGMFKALEGVKSGNVSVAIQGVNSYSMAVEQVDTILKSEKLRNRIDASLLQKRSKISFIIAFDSDMYENVGVLKAALGFQRELKLAYPDHKVYFLCWDIQYGKGLDDLKEYARKYNVDYHTLCFPVEASQFVYLTGQAQKETDRLFGVTKDNADMVRKEESYCKKLKENLWDKRISNIG